MPIGLGWEGYKDGWLLRSLPPLPAVAMADAAEELEALRKKVATLNVINITLQSENDEVGPELPRRAGGERPDT